MNLMMIAIPRSEGNNHDALLIYIVLSPPVSVYVVHCFLSVVFNSFSMLLCYN